MAWTDCRSTPSYFGGFAADMGLYIGPWPLLPPGELAGLGASEIDFLVMLPNPAAPGDVTLAGDGSYDTPIWDAWRNSAGFSYFGDNVGPSGWIPIPATPPAGVHLYVVAYVSSAPTSPPEFYVPATYAAGGASAHQTGMGHWSGTQAGFTRTGTPVTNGFGYLAEAVANTGLSFNASVEIDARVADLQALPGSSWTGPSTFGSTLLGAEKDSTGHALVQANEQGTRFDASAALPITPDAPGTQFLDWSQTPYIDPDGSPGLPVVYDLPSPLSLEIDGIATISGPAPTIGSYFGFGGNYTGTPGVFALPFDLYAEATLGAAVPPPPYTSATDLVIDYHAGATPVAAGFNIAGPYGIVGTRPAFMRTGLAHAPDVAGGADYLEGGDVGAAFSGVTWTGTYPTWHYWVPGGIVAGALLRTPPDPEEFRTVGGAPFKLLIPGVGWVPWRPHA